MDNDRILFSKEIDYTKNSTMLGNLLVVISFVCASLFATVTSNLEWCERNGAEEVRLEIEERDRNILLASLQLSTSKLVLRYSLNCFDHSLDISQPRTRVEKVVSSKILILRSISDIFIFV